MHAHAHTCTHMHAHACTCTHMHAHARTCTHMHGTHMHAQARTCTHKLAHARTCTHAHTHPHTHAHTCAHMHTHTCKHMHTHAHTYIILSPYITLINVRYVNFCWKLSMLPSYHETIFVFNHTVNSWVYVCTFLSLCEPCSLFLVIDRTLLSYFPSINTVVDFNHCLHSKIH